MTPDDLASCDAAAADAVITVGLTFGLFFMRIQMKNFVGPRKRKMAAEQARAPEEEVQEESGDDEEEAEEEEAEEEEEVGRVRRWRRDGPWSRLRPMPPI
eukprot:4847823-Pyramimonas_sp.AAC.1